MTILRSTLDTTSAEFSAARQAMEGKLYQLAADLEPALAGGSERSVARHRARGKLDRKSTRLNSSHHTKSRMPSSA